MMHRVFGLLSSKVLCLEQVLLSKFSSYVPLRTAFDSTVKATSFLSNFGVIGQGVSLVFGLGFESAFFVTYQLCDLEKPPYLPVGFGSF